MASGFWLTIDDIYELLTSLKMAQTEIPFSSTTVDKMNAFLLSEGFSAVPILERTLDES